MGMEEVTDNHKLYKKVFLKSLLFYRFLRIFVHTFCMSCFPRGRQARQFLFSHALSHRKAGKTQNNITY